MSTAVQDGVRTVVAEPGKDAQSAEAKRLFSDLMSFGIDIRRAFYADLNTRDWEAVLSAAYSEMGTPYGLWHDDPVGFVEDVLNETTWSKQREVLAAIPHHDRVAVPSAFGTGKTHISARAALWRSLVHPPGTSLTVTTATRFRQVTRQLWPHVRQAVAKANLPLIADQTQLKAVNRDGVEVVVAYGFSAPPHDEAAVQGIHAPRLFIVVDEAGGISRVIGGAMRGLMTGSDTRLLAIGNPPTDDEGSWFEQLCHEDDVRTIPISAYAAPQQSGERTQRCRACPPEMAPHRLGTHLVDQKWIDGTLRDYGEDAPFVVAKVHAKFPKGGPSRTIPSDWVDLAVESPEPEGDAYMRIDLLLDDERERSPYPVRKGARIWLGVDVAADGGDEFSIARGIGDLGQIVHSSTGSANTNAVDVAGKVLVEIRRAEKVRKVIGSQHKIRVKIDAIGVGWGVSSILEAWRTEGIHDAEIVAVVVSEQTYRDDDEGAVMRPNNKRAEMWLTGRALLQPDGNTGRGQLRLRIDKRTRSQLAAPTFGTNSQGKTYIESKDHMKARGVPSPDRAESLLLCYYEPIVKPKSKGEFRVIV